MLQQMRSAGVPPTEQTYAYNSLLGAYARRGFAFRQSTFDLLEEMSEAGIVESSTFNTLMDAAIECDDPEVGCQPYRWPQPSAWLQLSRHHLSLV